MKTLYITDLDGTLLSSGEAVSDFTADTVNSLVEKGMLFSYATARSFVTAGKITAGITAHFPVILYNGAFIMDSHGKKLLKTNFIPDEESRAVIKTILDADVYPLVYHYMDNAEKISYIEEESTAEMKAFLDTRQGDVRRKPVDNTQAMLCSSVYYITCIDSREKLYPLYQQLKDRPRLNCIYQKDVYSGRQWLEIMSVAASKANAIAQLKEMAGADRVVCFGDGKNDISMFRTADECYAMGNAVQELKDIATAVIDTNDNDGVAKWLLENGITE